VARHVDAAASEGHTFGTETSALALARETGQRDAAAVPEDPMPRNPHGASASQGA
jgi:hypothetical protein